MIIKNERLKKALRKEWLLWKGFMRHQFPKTILIYGAVNLLMIFAYMNLQQLGANLSLQPDLPTAQATQKVDPLIFSLMLLILPFALLLEDIGLRMMPWTLIKDTLRLDTIQVSPNPERRWWRLWIYHNVFSVYIVVSALWHSILHQSNIFTANPLGRFAYFAVQLVSGLMLAWIYIRKGFWQSYTIHVTWDYFMVSLSLLSSL